MSSLPSTGRAQGASTLRVHRFDMPGEQTVRFCGPVETIHVHWPNKARARASACAGGSCPPETHKMRLAWQGFAAAEIWQAYLQIWEPVVAQITPGWFDQLGKMNPRGSLWIVQRTQNTFGKDEIVAHMIERVDPSSLRVDIAVRPAVCRVYGQADIAWARPPILTQRQLLVPSTDAPPATAVPPTPRDQVEGTAEYEARLKADQEEIRKAGGFLKFMAAKQKGGAK